jgi:phosphatidylinositol alpha-1,6-mannosyltransferase
MISRIEKQTDIEGFGIVYLEANALGKPVVAGQSGGVAEAVMGSQTGLLVQDPTDPLETAQTILKILRNPELGQRLGQQGFKRVERDFNWDKIVSGLDRHLAS